MAYFSPQLLVVSFFHFFWFRAHRLFLLVQVGEKSIAKAESEPLLCSCSLFLQTTIVLRALTRVTVLGGMI